MCCRRYVSYYNLLGLSKNATRVEIKSAFLTLSKLHHPDLNPASASEEANKKFREINEAYSVLIDPAKRSIYDQQTFGSTSHPHFTSAPSDFNGKRYKYHQANAYTYARTFEYYDMSESEWEELYKKSGAGPAIKNHYRVVKLLLVLMVSGTLLHSCRIYYTHRNHQKKSYEESKRNQEIYEAVRERARKSTLKQQMDRLTQQNDTYLNLVDQSDTKKTPKKSL